MPRSFAKRRIPITREGWRIEEVFATVQQPDIQSCEKAIVGYECLSDHDGVHILAFHKKESDRGSVGRLIGDFNRLVWIDNSALQVYGHPDFASLVQECLAFEEGWRERLRPASVKEAVILPEASFAAKRGHDALWSRVRSVRIGADELDRVATYVEEFAIAHAPPAGLFGYMDSKQRVFKLGGARHGTARNALCGWKFTRNIGLDFHYDVQQGLGEEAVTITDARGDTRTFQTHANLDAHGVVVT